jgi:hypothetical protein
MAALARVEDEIESAQSERLRAGDTRSRGTAMKLAALQRASGCQIIQTFLALALYSIISWLYFGYGFIRRISGSYIGLGMDPTIHMWAMFWWPYAVAKGIDPLTTNLLWASSGFNLAQVVTIPGPSLLIYPITRAYGPVVAYNVLALACPALSALSSFVLCRYICRAFWPAVFGGYLFGFSQYALSEMGGHLFLLFIFPIPLAIYFVLLRLDGKLSRNIFILLLVTVLGFEFLSSTEIFATATLFGGMALGLCYVFSEAHDRARLMAVAVQIGIAYTIVALLLTPYLYSVLAGGVPRVANPPEAYSNDLLSFLIPTPVFALGSHRFAAVARQFRFFWGEMSGYLGPGLWIIFALFAIKFWKTRSCKLLLSSFAIVSLASLGPRLHVKGTPIIPLPWWLATKLPLIDLALPGRFGMYIFLTAAIIAVIYLSDSRVAAKYRFILGAAAFVFIAPNLTLMRAERTVVNTPPFFRSGEYKRYLAKGDLVLILPYNGESQSMLWQTQTSFYFRLVTGFYLPPADYQLWPISTAFLDNGYIQDFAEQLTSFLGAHQVKAVIVDPRAASPWVEWLSRTGMKPISTGGILLYMVPPAVLSSFRTATPHEMAQKQAAASFSAMVRAANEYLSRGYPLQKLSPWRARELNLLDLPSEQIPHNAADPWWSNLWLGEWKESLVGIGIVGNFQDLAPIVQAYGPYAVDVFFPFPARMRGKSTSANGQLLLIFTPQALKHAAQTGPVVENASTSVEK